MRRYKARPDNQTRRAKPILAQVGDAPPGCDARWPSWSLPILRELPLEERQAHVRGVVLGMSRAVSVNVTAFLENEGLAVMTPGGMLLATIEGARFASEHGGGECLCFVCARLRKDRSDIDAWRKLVAV
jgi:hypothetical protein